MKIKIPKTKLNNFSNKYRKFLHDMKSNKIIFIKDATKGCAVVVFVKENHFQKQENQLEISDAYEEVPDYIAPFISTLHTTLEKKTEI